MSSVLHTAHANHEGYVSAQVNYKGYFPSLHRQLQYKLLHAHAMQFCTWRPLVHQAEDGAHPFAFACTAPESYGPPLWKNGSVPTQIWWGIGLFARHASTWYVSMHAACHL